jgi:hypothetical protein
MRNDGHRRIGNAKRKISQIASAHRADEVTVYALSDDGKVFDYHFDSKKWFELAPITRCEPLVKKLYHYHDGRFATETLEYEND